MHRALILSSLVLAVTSAGCADVPVVDCSGAAPGITIAVAIDESTTPQGQTAPPSLVTPILLFKDNDPGRVKVVDASTDGSGCLVIDPASTPLEPGPYELEASINRGSCDWFDYEAFDYDGGSMKVDLTLTCNMVN